MYIVYHLYLLIRNKMLIFAIDFMLDVCYNHFLFIEDMVGFLIIILLLIGVCFARMFGTLFYYFFDIYYYYYN